MHTSLKRFWEEYKHCLSTTKFNYEATMLKFTEIQEEITTCDNPEIHLSELYNIYKNLFMLNYNLMLSHCKLRNSYVFYLDSDKQIFDEYFALDKKINQLLRQIISFKNLIESKQDNRFNI